MKSFLRDLWAYVKLLWKNAWSRTTAIVSSVLSFVLRFWPDAQTPAWIPTFLLIVLATAVTYSIFDIFRQQQREIERLKKTQQAAGERNIEWARLMWSEIGNNLDGFKYPLRYQDEMFKRYEAEPFTGLSADGKHAISVHYNYARSLRAMAQGKAGRREEDHMTFLYTGLHENGHKARQALSDIWSPWKDVPNRKPPLPQ